MKATDLRGPGRSLAVVQLISNTGLGAYYVTSALFFTQIVGLSPAQLGLGLTVAWSVALAVGVPLGHVTDRRGARETAIFFYGCAALAVGSYIFIRSFPLFLLAATLYAIGQRSGSAAQQALLAGVVPKEQITTVRAFLQVGSNAGLAIGSALGGMVLFFGTKDAYLIAFALDACGFLTASLMLLRVPPVAKTPAKEKGEKSQTVLQDRPYVVISLLNVILVLYGPLIDVALPLWVVRHTESPKWIVAVMFALNTLGVAFFQIRFARRVTGMASAGRYVVKGGLVLGASCVVFAYSGSGGSAWSAVVLLLAATAIQTLGEMMQSPATWEISFGLMPEGRHGQYQAFFGSGLTVAELIGPLVLTGLIVYWGSYGWLLLGALFVAASFLMVPAVRWGALRLDTAKAAAEGVQ